MIGTVKQYPTELAARRAVESIRVNLNADVSSHGSPIMRFKALADHYCQHEMPMDDHELKSHSTKYTNYGYLRKRILP